MEHEKIVTMYDTQSQADGAKRSLIKAGFLDHDIDIISGDRLREEGHEARHPGFWQSLFGKTLDQEQGEVYEDALRTGGCVLTLRAREDELPRAYSILDAHDTTGVISPGNSGSPLGEDADYPAAGETYTSGATDPVPVRTSLTGDESDEEVLRLAEERLEVGKRLVSEGTTRVRRYTVTDQVSETVSLREQHADIFRHDLNYQAPAESVDWGEKTIEVEETHEKPVVNKTAHVTEEVIVRKDESDRQEEISDSVRRQEVDVEHLDTPASSDLRTANKNSGAGVDIPVPGRDKPASFSSAEDPLNDSTHAGPEAKK